MIETPEVKVKVLIHNDRQVIYPDYAHVECSMFLGDSIAYTVIVRKKISDSRGGQSPVWLRGAIEVATEDTLKAMVSKLAKELFEVKPELFSFGDKDIVWEDI